MRWSLVAQAISENELFQSSGIMILHYITFPVLAEIVNILQKKNFAFNLPYFNSSTLFPVQYFACSYSGTLL